MSMYDKMCVKTLWHMAVMSTSLKSDAERFPFIFNFNYLSVQLQIKIFFHFSLHL